MKNLISFLFVAFVAMVGWHCGNTTADTSNNNAAKGQVVSNTSSSAPTSATSNGSFTMSGKIDGATDMRVFLDNFQFDNLVRTVGSTNSDGNGNFSLNVDKAIEKGIYRIRIGAKKAYLAMGGNETAVTINGKLETLNKYDFDINGSADAKSYVATRQNLTANKMDDKVKHQNIMELTNPVGAAHLAMSFLAAKENAMPVLKSIKDKLSSDGTASAKGYAQHYTAYISQIEQTIAKKKAQGRIAVGQPAPDIKLPSPKGKEYALSDLKGKVVLLDFWASWCGPCRKANPTVVKAYDKYNKQGFEVFSVSLDGLDGRTLARFGGDQNQIASQLENSKNRWVKAIEKDQLKWDYHVSDLKKWDSFPASVYAVRSIPRTFLIDRDGKIAFVDLHPIRHDLEAEIKKLL